MPRPSGPRRLGLLLVTLLGGCGGGIKPAEFRHATLGVVPGNDPRVASVRDECGKAAYAQGIDIDGRKVTDREVAMTAYTRHLTDQILPPGAGAMAGVQGAMAVRTGNPNYGTTPGASSAPTIKQPAYKERMDALEQETWACVEKAGFKRVPT